MFDSGNKAALCKFIYANDDFLDSEEAIVMQSG